MAKYQNNDEYLFYVNDILENNEFQKLDDIRHHGITRYEHSIRVSYYSYKIAKMLNLNYEVTARAGLLHDFFLNNEDKKIENRFLSMFIHPKYALENSIKNFELDDLGKNIIESHMFPIYKKVPKYAESWIVSLVDKAAAVYEFSYSISARLVYTTNILILLFINYIK